MSGSEYHFDYELSKNEGSPRPNLDDSTGSAKRVKGIVVGDDTGRHAYYFDLVTRHPVAARVKRLFDVAFSLTMLLLLAPAFLLIAAAIRLTSRGPVFFRQRRIGFRGNPFDMYKFRTMVAGADRMASGNGVAFVKPKNDPRVTAVGRFLRKHSLDELPQLLNVLTGTMSLVGPRPLRDIDVEHLPGPSSVRRFATPPGITGLWQVSGRSRCVGAKGLALDRHYVDRWSLWLDLEILIRTVQVVITGEDAV